MPHLARESIELLAHGGHVGLLGQPLEEGAVGARFLDRRSIVIRTERQNG
eukprot:COSAG01_NODE_1217_length_11190_cov_69.180417_5_plen_50_part_00